MSDVYCGPGSRGADKALREFLDANLSRVAIVLGIDGPVRERAVLERALAQAWRFGRLYQLNNRGAAAKDGK